MKEIKLKKQIMYIMMFSKLLIIAYIWINRNSGGFTTDQALAAITLITPLFAVYIGVMYREMAQLRSTESENMETAMISKSYRNLSYVTLTVYVFAIVTMVTLKAAGTFSFNQFQTTLTAVESGFGVYVGQIIFSLFKKQEE